MSRSGEFGGGLVSARPEGVHPSVIGRFTPEGLTASGPVRAWSVDHTTPGWQRPGWAGPSEEEWARERDIMQSDD